MIILLDPRSLLPLKVDVAKAFGSSGPSSAADSKDFKGGWYLLYIAFHLCLFLSIYVYMLPLWTCGVCGLV